MEGWTVSKGLHVFERLDGTEIGRLWCTCEESEVLARCFANEESAPVVTIHPSACAVRELSARGQWEEL